MNAKLLNNLQVIAEDGVTYGIYNKTDYAQMVLLDGSDMAPVRRTLQQVTLANGAIDRGFRIDSRQMVLNLYLEAATEAALELMIDALINIFAPTDTALKLRATRLDGTQRQIDCFLDGKLDTSQSKRIGMGQPVIVPLIAPDPIWYDPTQQSATVSLSSGSGTINIPATMTWEDFPVIQATGPLSGFYMWMNSTYYLEFTTPIPASETFIIDLRPGYKTVKRSSDGASRISYMNPAYLTNFNLFRLFPLKMCKMLNPAATQNVMLFGSPGGGNTSASSVTVTWYKRYLSLE